MRSSDLREKKRKRQKKNPPDSFLREISQKMAIFRENEPFLVRGCLWDILRFFAVPLEKPKNHKVGATEKKKRTGTKKTKKNE